MFKPTKDQSKIISNVLGKIKFVINGNDTFNENSFISLKGPAGTGKTTTTKFIVKDLLKQRKKIIMVSFTHSAVNVLRETVKIKDGNLKFSTLHSFLGLTFNGRDENGKSKFKLSRKYQENFDVCIVDESSMIDTELFKHLKESLFNSNRIKCLLFIGDQFQLRPIENKSHVIYENNMINDYELTEIIRNPDMEVLDFVNNIREMIKNKKNKKHLMTFLVNEKLKSHNKIKFYDSRKSLILKFLEKERIDNNDDILATFTNEKVNLLNQKIRDYYVGKLLNGEVPEIYPTDKFVIQESNDYFQNSEVVELKEVVEVNKHYLKKSFKSFRCLTKKNTFFFKIKESSKEEYNEFLEKLRLKSIETKDWKDYFKVKQMFLEVKYHYVSTVHKLQGTSFENIYIDLSNISFIEDDLLLRLFYVACTRSKNTVHLMF